MSYIKAETVLPQKLLELVQEYAGGQYLYIPKRPESYKEWGEKTGSKRQLDLRNKEIYIKYKTGFCTAELASEYFLSEKSIQRIVLKEKKQALND